MNRITQNRQILKQLIFNKLLKSCTDCTMLNSTALYSIKYNVSLKTTINNISAKTSDGNKIKRLIFFNYSLWVTSLFNGLELKLDSLLSSDDPHNELKPGCLYQKKNLEITEWRESKLRGTCRYFTGFQRNQCTLKYWHPGIS